MPLLRAIALVASSLALACASSSRDDDGYWGMSGAAGDDGDDDADGGDDGGAQDDGGGDDGGDDADDGGDDGDDDGDDGADGPSLDVGNAGDDSACHCAPKSDLIFLLAWDGVGGAGQLWTFDPESLDFEQQGTIGCSADGLSQVFSMGVGRDAKAWVQYQPSGDIFTYDVNQGECADPGFTPGQSGFNQFGMAFVSQSADNPCDDLYAIRMQGLSPTECPGQACGTLGVIDPDTAALQVINGVSYSGGELTGTGDGRLFAFLGVSPAKLVEFEKETGEVLQSIDLDGLELTDAFAFAFWGGDFYFFTEATDAVPGFPDAPSKVVKLDYDGSDEGVPTLKTVVPSAPILVAGAGVSTCAPITPEG